MPIKDWPTSERPREKLLQRGAQSLSDAELIAIFLRTGVNGKTAVDLARELLQHFGSFKQLLQASRHDIQHVRGFGTAKYVTLQASLEIGQRFLQATLQQSDALTDPQATCDYLRAKLGHYQQEVFACLFLDNQNCVLGYEELFYGTINWASIHPREVVKCALRYNAAALIIAHNHPSSIAEPSQDDCHITEQLRLALALVDIRLLDHIIVSIGVTTSFAKRGLL